MKETKNTLEVFNDSDWSGNGDMKSTSSAVHVMNGIIIHSTSRSQKRIPFEAQKPSGMRHHQLFAMPTIYNILLSL